MLIRSIWLLTSTIFPSYWRQRISAFSALVFELQLLKVGVQKQINMFSSVNTWKRLSKLPEMNHHSVGPPIHPSVMATIFLSGLYQVCGERIGMSCRLDKRGNVCVRSGLLHVALLFPELTPLHLWKGQKYLRQALDSLLSLSLFLVPCC